MTVFVDDATLRDARDRAARLPLGSVEQQRWQDIAAYGAARQPDPNPERAAVLRGLLSLPGADDRAVLDATGRLLSDEVTGNTGSAALARQVYALCLQWFDEDVKEAAPLLELFTGHHRDPEGGPPQADPELVGRLAEWIAERAGSGARSARSHDGIRIWPDTPIGSTHSASTASMITTRSGRSAWS